MYNDSMEYQGTCLIYNILDWMAISVKNIWALCYQQLFSCNNHVDIRLFEKVFRMGR